MWVTRIYIIKHCACLLTLGSLITHGCWWLILVPVLWCWLSPLHLHSLTAPIVPRPRTISSLALFSEPVLWSWYHLSFNVQVTWNITKKKNKFGLDAKLISLTMYRWNPKKKIIITNLHSLCLVHQDKNLVGPREHQATLKNHTTQL